MAFAVLLGLIAGAMHIADGVERLDAYRWLILALAGASLLSMFVDTITTLFARETVQVYLGELVHGWELFGLRREGRYPLSAIRALGLGGIGDDQGDKKLISAWSAFGKVGTVTFDCGEKTIRIGTTLDEAHAAQVVDWIARRSPRTIREY